MAQTSRARTKVRLLLVLLAGLFASSAGGATTAAAPVTAGTALREKYTALHDQLGQTQFQMPLYLESSEASW